MKHSKRVKYNRNTKSKRKPTRRRLRYVGGAKSMRSHPKSVQTSPHKQDHNLRDTLEASRLKIITFFTTTPNIEGVLLQILPNFSSETHEKKYFATIILLIGLISHQIQKFCFIYVKGGIATQFALHKNKCRKKYNTSDIDLFIKPTSNSKYSAKECGELVVMFIHDVMNSLRKDDRGQFLRPIVRSSTPGDASDVIKFSYKPNHGPIIAMMDISFIEPETQTLTTFVPIIAEISDKRLPLVFYVPTIDCLLSEKLMYLYLYADKDEYYMQSLVRSLKILIECIGEESEEITHAIGVAASNIELMGGEDEELVILDILDKLKKLFV